MSALLLDTNALIRFTTERWISLQQYRVLV
jgi:hypothetical protein